MQKVAAVVMMLALAVCDVGASEHNGEASEPIEVIGAGEFSEYFRLIDKDTGDPIPGVKYRISTQSGLAHEGVTDSNGYTVRVYTEHEELINCTFLGPYPLKIE